MTSPTDHMTLFTAATEMLSELKTLTAETRQQNEEVKAGLISLINLLNGFRLTWLQYPTNRAQLETDMS